MAEIKKNWNGSYYVAVNERVWTAGLSYEEAEAVAFVLNKAELYVGGEW